MESEHWTRTGVAIGLELFHKLSGYGSTEFARIRGLFGCVPMPGWALAPRLMRMIVGAEKFQFLKSRNIMQKFGEFSAGTAVFTMMKINFEKKQTSESVEQMVWSTT